MSPGTVIVGAGQSGLSVAQRLRALGYTASIMLVGEEAHPPYQRPPLSKKLLAGAVQAHTLQLKPRSFYDDQRITLRLGTAVTAIDTAARQLRLVDGSTLPYATLVLATGTRARPLPSSLVQGDPPMRLLRSLDDAEALAAELRPERHLVVVGGGFVGLEAAATARQRGLQVTVLEQAPRLLQRVAGPEVSQRLQSLHQSHGVRILTGHQLARLQPAAQGRGAQLTLADGQVIGADAVLAGIGALPNTELAQAAGVPVDDGILVDHHGQTSVPGVYACGDCARFAWPGGTLRLESVQNAIALGECVAQSIAGQASPYAPVPWFWSDQYDCKLQMVGLTAGHDRVVVRDSGAHPTQGASFWYFQGRRLLGMEALNDASAFIHARRWLEQARHPSAESLADLAVAFKDQPLQPQAPA